MPFIIVSRDSDTVALVSEQLLETQADAIDAVSSALSVGALDRSGTFLVLDLDRAAPVAVVEVPTIVELPLEEDVTAECVDVQLEGSPAVVSAGDAPEDETQSGVTAESELGSLLVLEDLPPVEVPVVDLPEVGVPELPMDEQAAEVDLEAVTGLPDPVMSAALDDLLAGSRVEAELEEPVEAEVVDAEPAESTRWPWNESSQEGGDEKTAEASAEEDPAEQNLVPEPRASVAEIDEEVLAPIEDSSLEAVEDPPVLVEEDSLAEETIIPSTEEVAASVPAAQAIEDSEPETIAPEDAVTTPEPEQTTAESPEPETEDHPAVAEAEAVLEAAAAAVAVEAEECLADVPGYEAGDCDLSQLTCVDCVYVNTCPNKEERAPSTCGSFQWTSV